MEEIKEEWANMINNGELTLGEPCHPQTILRLSVKTGELRRTEYTAYGRKISLLDIRKKLLANHEHLMHLHTDDEIEKLSNEELKALLQNENYTS